MLDIHKELKILVVKCGTSMTKTLNKMREKGYNIPVQSNFSAKLTNETVKFKEIQEFIDYLGYELVIKEK